MKNELNGYYRKRRSIFKTLFDSITAAFIMIFQNHSQFVMLVQGLDSQVFLLKICFPHLKVTIVDSLQKRINFLNHLAQKLELSDVAFCHDRAETFGKKKVYVNHTIL